MPYSNLNPVFLYAFPILIERDFTYCKQLTFEILALKCLGGYELIVLNQNLWLQHPE